MKVLYRVSITMIVIALAMMAFCFIGCGGGSTPIDQPSLTAKFQDTGVPLPTEVFEGRTYYVGNAVQMIKFAQPVRGYLAPGDKALTVTFEGSNESPADWYSTNMDPTAACIPNSGRFRVEMWVGTSGTATSLGWCRLRI